MIDYERAWTELKEAILSKKSHGQRDLLSTMAEIEVENLVEDGFDPSPVRRSGDSPLRDRPRAVARHG
jgi:hypothetical protein